MKKLIVTLFMLLVCIFTITAQGIIIQITDADTNESLPNASIIINGTENLIANDDGYFTLPEKEDAAEVLVSFIGYNHLNTTIGALKQSRQVKLKQAVYEMENLTISNFGNNPEAIMGAVKQNFDGNYRGTADPVKNKVFFRSSSSMEPKQMDVDITKSTGFTKAQLKEVNKDVKAFINKIDARKPQEFSDILCNYYTGSIDVNGKPGYTTKIEVIKATKLRSKSGGASLDDISKESLGIIAQHLDSTKYYRVKSGWFGSRDTVQLFDKTGKHSPIIKQTNRERALSDVQSFLLQNSVYHYNFITKPELYTYEYKGMVPTEDGQAYVLNFRPRKGKAKYEGTLYIDNTDFAVLRTDFSLAEGKKLSGINLKFLLGIKQAENLSKGTLIFKKKPTGKGYYMQYGSKISGDYIYVNRPVKFIEIAKGDKDVFAFDMMFEASNVHKEEYFNMMRSDIAAAELENVKQPDFDYQSLNSYNPAIWKEYGGIEPLQEMKQFKAVE